MAAPISRRTFFVSSASAAIGLGLSRLAPAWASPAETLNVACVGVGGMGGADLAQISRGKGVRIVALCDVDANNLGRAAKGHVGARTFADYRKLFDEMGKEIDAVVVSTPDHMHGSVALAAMALGKHVYCQKPIAHNLHECRQMTTLAAEKKVVTQMGTQVHGHAVYRTAVATLQSGVIGKLSEAHLWVSKSWAGPPGGRPSKADDVPAHLDWDLWLGVAPERPYVKGLYHPGNWRGWKDFGSGTLGDMGCHVFDPVFSALELSAPRTVVSRGTQHYEEAFAPDSDVRYWFPGTRHTTETLAFRWTDGRKVLPDAARAQLPPEEKLPGAGSFLIGETGVMVLPHIGPARLYREGKKLEPELVKREGRNHWHEWTDACRGEGQTSTPFSYAGPLTEAVLVGTVAGRFQGRTPALGFGEALFRP